MTITTSFLREPRFRDHVLLHIQDDICVIRCREQEYELELEPETRSESVRLLESLRSGGRSIGALEQDFPAIESQVASICRDLDRLGVLTDTTPAYVEMKSGTQFYRELRRFVERARRIYSDHPLQQALVNKDATIAHLIGYVLEYFHVVRMCPGLLAPSLAHCESRRSRDLLQAFFVSELHHDRMIESALRAVGIRRDQLDRMIPLPMTFAVCSSLGAYASQHPLSFKAMLFLFEEPNPDFDVLFRERCEKLGLPPAFYDPILEHSAINEHGDHESITRSLLEEVPCVCPEEELVVKRHAAGLVESMSLMERQTIEYYGGPDASIPRCFD